MEKRFLKGDAAIEHLKADGTLWGICGIKTGDNYWRLENGRFVCGDVDGTDWLLTDVHEREVRTEPPLQADKVADFAHGLKHSSSLYAVGDIVTGDEAYRLVELGAKVRASIGCGDKTYEVFLDGRQYWLVAPSMRRLVSHARRTLWNPDADEWRIVEPPKTITAEEARKVVAAGGAVARTFVAPESEWADGSVNNGPGTKSVADFAYALFADGSEWVVRRAAPENAGVLTAEELADVEFAEANYLYGLSVRLAATVRSLEKELTKVTKEYSDLCAQWRAR
jgi:hypothetical protein